MGLVAPRRSLPVLLFVVLAGLTLPAGAASKGSGELFRYENEDGVIVLSNSLPPKYATRGYTIIDYRGRVIRVVPRQLTEKELRQRAAAEKAEREAQAARDERRQHDEELLRLYSTPEDVERAKDRKVASIQGAIDTVQVNIQRLLAQKRNLEAKAADLERAGSAIPQTLIDSIQSLEDQIRAKEQEIATRKQQIDATEQDYASDRERLRYLLGLSGTAASGNG